MKNESLRIVKSPVILFSEILHGGLELDLNEKFGDLYRANEEVDPDLLERFKFPIQATGSVMPVGSKVDLRGRFSTKISGVCDRCMAPLDLPIEGSMDTFLMAATQFSEHDKPGGKVIHGPTRHVRDSRHHSRSKAEVLTDAEGEHDDESFGAFDGQTVDLRPLLRELLILQIPMKMLCDESCRGLCLVCSGNINQNKCVCESGPTMVASGDNPDAESPLAKALRQKVAKKTTKDILTLGSIRY